MWRVRASDTVPAHEGSELSTLVGFCAERGNAARFGNLSPSVTLKSTDVNANAALAAANPLTDDLTDDRDVFALIGQLLCTSHVT